MARRYYDNEDDDAAGLLVALGLGALVGWALTPSALKNEVKHIKIPEYDQTRMVAITKRWEKRDAIFNERLETLKKYHLDKIIGHLVGAVKSVYIESLNCFLFGNDLASSNMIVLTIEVLLREKVQDQDTKLYSIIQNLEDNKKISPELAHKLHILRAVRNQQSHSVNKIEELDLLSLFKAVGDIQKLVI